MPNKSNGMSFYQLVDRLDANHRLAGEFDSNTEIQEAVDAILDGCRDQEDALDKLEILNETGNPGFTPHGYAYTADALYKAIVLKWGKEVVL